MELYDASDRSRRVLVSSWVTALGSPLGASILLPPGEYAFRIVAGGPGGGNTGAAWTLRLTTLTDPIGALPTDGSNPFLPTKPPTPPTPTVAAPVTPLNGDFSWIIYNRVYYNWLN